jgi:hypothetical protein
LETGGLPKGSYNFLLVCHHWFQVALGTPGLWSFWGNSIDDWTHRHARCRTTPLDLVLRQYTGQDLDDALHDALQDRATRDTIRRVRLIGPQKLLSSVISSIIAKGEETRPISLESFMLMNSSASVVDISGFFSRYHFPKLQCLDLRGFNVSSWGLLGSRTTSLTALSLIGVRRSSLPTVSQMLSILSANPNLQSLELSRDLVPDIDSDRSSPQIQLRHLKMFHLASTLPRVFGLLNCLELPDKMDDLNLSLSDYSPLDLPQTLGPYLGNLVRHRSPGGLRLSVDPGPDFSILVGDPCEGDSTQEDWFVTVDTSTSVVMEEEEADKLCFDTIAHIPQKEVVDLTTTLPILRSEDLCVQMCNLAHLHLEGVDLSAWFVEPDTREHHIFEDLLRGLRSISISNPSLTDGDWSPLTTFLTRRAAVGKRISSLRLSCYPRMGEGVIESIMRTVEVFEERDSYDESDDGYQ